MRENPQQRFQLMGMSQQCERTMWDLHVLEFGLQIFWPAAQLYQHKEKWSETGKRTTDNPESQLLRVVDISQWQYCSVQCSEHPSLDVEQSISHQFSSVQSLSRVRLFVIRLFATPRIAAHQASLSITNSRSLRKQMSIESVMPPSHLIFCHPLLLLPLIKLPTSAGSSKKQEFQKNIYFCFIDYAKSFDCVDHHKLWKILKEMEIPDHLTCLLRNLYAGQEATVRTGHGTTDWFQIGKRVRQGYILSPCLFNFYAVAPHSSTLAWKIPWMEEPGRLQPRGSLRVRQDWAISLSLFTFCHKVVSSAYLKLLIFLPEILIPVCGSSSPAFLMMHST